MRRHSSAFAETETSIHPALRNSNPKPKNLTLVRQRRVHLGSPMRQHLPPSRGIKWSPCWTMEAKSLEFHAFDGAYLERLRTGDFKTQEHFVAYFSELIQLKLRSRLSSPQAIEDVRQETFARVFAALRNPGGIRQAERLGAFVNSVCNNVLLEHYRSSSRETSIDGEDER